MGDRARFMRRIGAALKDGNTPSKAANRARLEALCGVAGAIFATLNDLDEFKDHPTLPSDLANAALDGMEDWLRNWKLRN